MSTWFESLHPWQAALLYGVGFVIASLTLLGGLLVVFLLGDWRERRQWERDLRERNAIQSVINFLRWGSDLPPCWP